MGSNVVAVIWRRWRLIILLVLDDLVIASPTKRFSGLCRNKLTSRTQNDEVLILIAIITLF